jgi:hypothetical protein
VVAHLGDIVEASAQPIIVETSFDLETQALASGRWCKDWPGRRTVPRRLRRRRR